ncbi:hypothetical protein LTS02_012041 [Friedmanniomyces endolithicus]|nr:hypothetical protein LTS02_012041 [Friedmanniomyces endolithicus]
MSGIQPHPRNLRMFARGARMRLDDEKIRIQTLTMHADHKCWEDTPYISFTKSSQSLQDLANQRRTRRRGDQKVVVIDPRIRIKLGLPILDYGEEMAHYHIDSPYARDYWRNHYLCLWEVTPQEVVGIWEWDDLRRTADWYEEVIMPAVHRHRRYWESDDYKGAVQWRDSDMGFKSESADDTYNDTYWSDSDDSYERVCEENSTGEIMKMWEDLRLAHEHTKRSHTIESLRLGKVQNVKDFVSSDPSISRSG